MLGTVQAGGGKFGGAMADAGAGEDMHAECEEQEVGQSTEAGLIDASGAVLALLSEASVGQTAPEQSGAPQASATRRTLKAQAARTPP